MTNPTSNYNFQMPTASDLVTDLPADFEVFGQAVDTQLKALQPGTTLGDLAYSSATANTSTRLPIGTSGQVLAVSGGGEPTWTTTADVTPLTTKGDLFTFTTVDARIGVGANNTVLTADSAEATGLKWATAGAAATSYSLLNSGNTTLPTGASTFTVSGLTSFNNYYVFFQSVASATSGAYLAFRINASTASNYNNFGWNFANSSSFSANDLDRISEISTNIIYFAKQATTSAISGGINIQGGASAGTKMYQAQSGGPGDGGRAYNINGYWSNSALITSLQISTSAGNFASGSMFIYGGE